MPETTPTSVSTITQDLPAIPADSIQQTDKWNNLKSQLSEWFYQPDTEALAATLSVAISHYFKQDDPVWLMLLGPPGTGKTSICIAAVECLSETYRLDDLTPTTFLSTYINGKKDYSLLNNIGTPADRSGILLMPDFTCFISKRDDARREIAGQLRRIYDGNFDRSTGVGRRAWQGKVTMIVAATPAVERAWGMMRDLGERFMQVRWPRGDGISQATLANKQIGSEKAIKRQLQESVWDMVDPSTLTPETVCRTSTESIERGVAHLAEIVARSRAHIHRERDGQRAILEVPEPEGPTRIMKALAQVARAHASLFRRLDVADDDFKIARRMALDSIPTSRYNILKSVASYPDGEVGWANICRFTGMPPTTVTRALDDMVALDMLEQSPSGVEKIYKFTENFRALWEMARPILNL